MRCNNLTNVSEAIDADVFMCDTNGKVILCKELLSSNLEVQQNGKCTLHEHYQIPQSVLDKALCGPYYERGKLDGMFEEEHIIAAEPVTVNGQVAGIIIAAEPTGGSFKGFVFNIMRMFLFAALMALAIGFIVIYLFTMNLTRPLREMYKATKAYATGDFSPRVEVSGSDELARSEEHTSELQSPQ